MGTKGEPRDPAEIITTNVEELPVVRAWRALGPRAGAPARVELLRRRNKSVVYRLPGVGDGNADVIAKQCVHESALAESEVYRVLQGLPLSQPRYYGYAAGEQEGFAWLFLGDAAGDTFTPDDPLHRDLATRWLAVLHTTSSELAVASTLPDRGPAHYLEHLHSGYAAIDRTRMCRWVSAADGGILDDMRLWLERIEARWADVEAICGDIPRVLVHGDFAARNVRVRHDGKDGASLLVFDWEVAGWGTPGVDLVDTDLDLYHALVQPKWPHLERETLRRAACIGRLLRGGVAAVHWDAQKCVANPHHGMDDMLIFRRRIVADLETLGWWKGAPPSFTEAPRLREQPTEGADPGLGPAPEHPAPLPPPPGPAAGLPGAPAP